MGYGSVCETVSEDVCFLFGVKDVVIAVFRIGYVVEKAYGEFFVYTNGFCEKAYGFWVIACELDVFCVVFMYVVYEGDGWTKGF